MNCVKPLLVVGIFLFSIFPASVHSKSPTWEKTDRKTIQQLMEKEGKSKAQSYEEMGIRYFKKKKWGKSKLFFTHATEENPKLYRSWYYLGLLNIGTETGNYYFQKAKEINPDFAPTYYWLAYAACRNYQDEAAIKLFKQYLAIARHRPHEKARVYMAQDLLHQLQLKKEGKYLEMIRKPFQKDDIPFYMVIIGEAPNAKKAVQRAFELVQSPGVVFDGNWNYLNNGDLGEGLAIYRTDPWKGLKKGCFVIADGLFTSQTKALTLKERIRPHIPDVYVKRVVNPRVLEILFLADDHSWVIWSGLGVADLEQFHYTDLIHQKDTLLCSGRRIPPHGHLPPYVVDHEIKALMVDKEKECFYFYDNGFKVFAFNEKKPRDVMLSKSVINALKRTVKSYLKNPAAQIDIRWVIGDNASVVLNHPSSQTTTEGAEELLRKKRTFYMLSKKTTGWKVVSQYEQEYLTRLVYTD